MVLALVLLLAPSHAYACHLWEPLRPADPPMRRIDVGDLKLALRRLGLWPQAIAHEYCPDAVAVVKAFQDAHGLSPNGIVCELTWSALGRPWEAAAPPPGPSPPGGARLLLVDTTRLTLTLYVKGQPFRTYPVAIGRQGLDTPLGEWRIRSKGVDPGGPFGTRWMGLNVPWGTYGIHGTNAPGSIGTRASQGCIRMHNRHVEELFPWVPVGTPVVIIGREPYLSLSRALKPGSTGPAVVQLQGRLTHFGFDPGYADGRFRSTTEQAVRELQLVYGLPVTGSAGTDVFFLLGLR